MTQEKKVQLNVYIPEYYRNQLRRIAAKRMLDDPNLITTGATIAAEILCEYLKMLEEKEKEL
jgi:hypothetical protein